MTYTTEAGVSTLDILWVLSLEHCLKFPRKGNISIFFLFFCFREKKEKKKECMYFSLEKKLAQL